MKTRANMATWKENLERALELSDARNFFEAMQAVNTAFGQWEMAYLLGEVRRFLRQEEIAK